MEGTWYYVYILRSQKTGKFYVGFTKDLSKRINQHNNGFTKSTKFGQPFSILLAEAFIDEKDARAREKFYKTGRGREILKKKLFFTLINFSPS